MLFKVFLQDPEPGANPVADIVDGLSLWVANLGVSLVELFTVVIFVCSIIGIFFTIVWVIIKMIKGRREGGGNWETFLELLSTVVFVFIIAGTAAIATFVAGAWPSIEAMWVKILASLQ